MSHEFIGHLLCSHCGRSYYESKGCPSHGIAAGTSWENVPPDWRCPDCGAPKWSFESFENIYQRALSVLGWF